MGRSRDCSQVEDELEERDAMDCEDDEMMKQWEEVSKEEKVLELTVSQAQMKRKEAKVEMETKL